MYLDFLIYEAFYKPLAWVGVFSEILDSNTTKYGLFFLAFAVTWFFKKATPGLRILGISYFQNWGHDPVAVVEKSHVEKERWWVMLVGVLLVLEGAKNLVRWTQGLPPQPFLGGESPDWLLFTMKSVIGAVSIYAGVLLLQKKKAGALIGSGLSFVQAIPILIFNAAFVDWSVNSVASRRALQGLPVRDGEVEFMTTFVTMGMPAVLIAAALIMLMVFLKLKADEGPQPA